MNAYMSCVLDLETLIPLEFYVCLIVFQMKGVYIRLLVWHFTSFIE